MIGGSPPRISVVVSTYEWPRALDAVLASLAEQEDPAFEVVIADDGSGFETAAVVEKWQRAFSASLVHAWQDDRGSRQARARNLGALRASGDYLVFIDGDVLARRGFVAAVRRALIPGWFLAGKRLNLSRQLSERVLEHKLRVWRWSAARWLLLQPRELFAASLSRERNRPGVLVPIRDRRRTWRPHEQDFHPPHDAFGFFMGVARDDFWRVNGFEGRYVGWGAEDVDLAVRLGRIGLRCGWGGPATTLLHLWHRDRRESRPANLPLLHETQLGTRIEAVEGLRELGAELERAQESANRVGSSSSASAPEKR